MVTAAGHYVTLIGELKHNYTMVTAAAHYVKLSIVELRHKDIMVTAAAHYVPLISELNTKISW